LMLAWAPPPLWPGRVLREGSPLIAGFYVAAMIERALNYRLVQGRRREANRHDLVEKGGGHADNNYLPNG
jgi:hypothetical protein